MLLSDWEIRERCDHSSEMYRMIHPFSEGVQGGGVISYGLSHAGYDLRLGEEIFIFKNTYNEIIDPKRFKDEEYRARVFDVIKARKDSPSPYIIPPHSYALGVSLEYLRMPLDLKGRVVGKSTLARCGVLINTTPLEPGWHGHLTIEISNITPCPAMIYAREGIAQLEFELLSSKPESSYEGKKYQGQIGVTPARIVE
jgi:dCTP deaminase